MQSKAVVYAHPTGFRGDLDNPGIILPITAFLAFGRKNAVHRMVQVSQFLASLDHLHTAILWSGIVQHNHYGQHGGVGVGEKGQVLVPAKNALPLCRGFGGQFLMLQLNIGSDQGNKPVQNPCIPRQIHKNGLQYGDFQKMHRLGGMPSLV